jgi:hypothetical protein
VRTETQLDVFDANDIYFITASFFCSSKYSCGSGSSAGTALAMGWMSRDQIPVGARFSAPVQTGPGAHPASRTMATRSFPGLESGWGVTQTPHSLVVLRSTNRV